MRTISSKGILHIFGLGSWRRFNECHRPGSILEHTVVSIYLSVAFRFRVLLATLTQPVSSRLTTLSSEEGSSWVLSRKRKRHSSPLCTLHNAENAQVGPTETANKTRRLMEKKENDRTNRSPLRSPFSQYG